MFAINCGDNFIIYFYVNKTIEKLEKLWISYKFDSLIPVENIPYVAFIPALYPFLYMVANLVIFSFQATRIIPSQSVELGINSHVPYLLPILTPFVIFGWGSPQGIYMANVNRSRANHCNILAVPTLI